MQPTKQHWPALCEPAMCAAAVCHGLCRGFVRNLPQNAFVPRAGPRPPATAAKSRASGFDCTGLGSVTDSLSIEWDCTALVAVWAAAAPAPPRPACAVVNDLAPPPHAAPLQYSRAPLRVHRCESCTFCEPQPIETQSLLPSTTKQPWPVAARRRAWHCEAHGTDLMRGDGRGRARGRFVFLQVSNHLSWMVHHQVDRKRGRPGQFVSCN